MSRVALIAQREFLENIRTKSFWIGILIFPLILALFFVVPVLLERTKGARKYAVVDRSGWLAEAVERRAAVADLSRALSLAATRYRAAGDELDRLPAVLQRVAPTAAELEPGELTEATVWLLDGTGPPPRGAEGLATHRAQLIDWWRGLEPEEARELSSDLARGRYARVPVSVEPDSAEALLNRMIAQDDLFAYFVIGADPIAEAAEARYVSRNLTDQDLREWYAELATEEVQARRMQHERIDPRTIARIRKPFVFEGRRVTTAGAAEDVDARDQLAQWAPVAFVYILWLAVFSVSQMLLTSTIEEKSNRTVEVLLSSVSPFELMAGKIAGIAATGLTTVGSWIVAFVLGTRFLPGLLGTAPGVDLTSLVQQPLYLTSFIIYFALGYLFYAALLVAVGAVCNSIREAQNLMGPVLLLMLIPLLAMVPIGRDPNGTLARVLSFIPPFTPFVMMNRSAGPPSPLEYVLTTLVLLAAVAGAFWAAAKVFRIGILLTGKPPRLREIVRWIRAPVGTFPARARRG